MVLSRPVSWAAALVGQVVRDLDGAPVSEKLKALLHIAGKTAYSGRRVTPDDVLQAARRVFSPFNLSAVAVGALSRARQAELKESILRSAVH